MKMKLKNQKPELKFDSPKPISVWDEIRTNIWRNLGLFFEYFDVFWDVCDLLLVGDFTSRDQTPRLNVDPSLKVLVQISTLPKT